MHIVVKLNIDGTIIGSMRVDEAISGIVTGKYNSVIDDPQGKVYRSQNLEVAVPLVVMSTEYDQIGTILREISKFPGDTISHKSIRFRDKEICCYCGSPKGVTADHIIPQSAGGPSSWDNLVSCCHKCNEEKGCRSLSDTGFTKLYEPRKPTAGEFALSASHMGRWKELFTIMDIMEENSLMF